MKPISVIKTDQGILKIYNHTSDYQCLITGGVKFPELWFTRHNFSYTEKESLTYAIEKAVSCNRLTGIETIY